jgi:pyroglutamyl-peptidase
MPFEGLIFDLEPQPFLNKFPINSSWEICSSLPDYLPPTSSSPGIRIVKHPEPIRVVYHEVADLVPKLLSQAEPKPDLVLHMGLAAKFGRRHFAMERQSQRGVYGKEKDVDGCTFGGEEEAMLWSDCPKRLKPTFDLDDVWRRWQDQLAKEDVDARPSDDPGNFLCGFIYYASMAWYWKRAQKGKETERPVIFMHVPDLPREADVGIGRKVALALIRAMVESRERRGAYDPLVADADIDKDVPMGMAEMGNSFVSS